MNPVLSSSDVSAPAAGNGDAQAMLRRQVRGSGLLIVGRVLSIGVTAFTQVLIVRHLPTREYGAWAYALAAVLLWQTISSFGCQEAIPRFVSIYHQQNDRARLFGTMLLSAGLIVATGALVIAAFFAFPNQLLALMHEQRESLTVLAVLIFLVPVDALDGLLMSLFASLASPRSIFWRRHVLAPGLRLMVVVLLISLHAGVRFLAFGYLAASVFGIVLYVVVFVRHLRAQKLLDGFRLRDVRLPFRELLGFMLPMMTSDLMPILNESVVVLLLGYFHGMRDVALYRVVMPVAALNHLVGLTSGILYMPSAARLFARGDREGLAHLYWKTAAWVAVLTFPIFVATFAFARPLTLALFGARYADSAVILAIVAAGYYFEVIWGFNGMTLKALNKKSYVVGCNLITAVVNLALTFTLVPRYGALGAAVTTACTMAFIAILRQGALKLAAGIDTMKLQVLGFYAMIGAASALLLLARSVIANHLVLACAIAMVSMLGVLLFTRRQLQVGEMFPESIRIPWMRRFLA